MKQIINTRIVITAAVMLMAVALLLVGFQSAYAAITTSLDFGDRGADVSELQTFLSNNANVYPSKLVTGYFGQLTKAGVERYQTQQGIVTSGTPETTGYGRVGPRTRAAINANLTGGAVSGTDVRAPLITSVSVNTGRTSANVTWTASESSQGKVYYSSTPIRISNVFDVTGRFSGEPIVNGTLAQFDGQSRISHTVNIDNLAPNSRYYYLVVIYDAAKNVSFTTPTSFVTNN